jgi:hypothetical protein
VALFELDEGDERIRLYEIATKEVPGLRPALITPEVARWHARFVRDEYGLLGEEEGTESVRLLRQNLPGIHRQTLASFQEFREVLTECVFQ